VGLCHRGAAALLALMKRRQSARGLNRADSREGKVFRLVRQNLPHNPRQRKDYRGTFMGYDSIRTHPGMVFLCDENGVTIESSRGNQTCSAVCSKALGLR